MYPKNWKKLILFGVAIFIFGTHSGLACICDPRFVPPCKAYEYADAVFIGKLVSKIDSVSNRDPVLFGVFEVQKTFKGEPEKRLKLKLPVKDCNYNFQVNESYFIYADYDLQKRILEIDPCQRSRNIKDAADDIDYVNKLDSPIPSQSIMVDIEGLTNEELQNTKVTVKNAIEVKEHYLNNSGFFNFETKHTGKFTIKIEIPIEIEITVLGEPDIDIEAKNFRTIITYDVFLPEHKCDYRMFIGKKYQLPANNSI